ncbi:ZNF358 [Branchiostoma lanceolatum]|uniref:ZNF358 protein n=1 Tax=Branchiostoma lanceolatum TaxID=7740 RepID=A0A8K0EVI8_BRALA|nr:ZNF358 [Branchiostoma lanceolatum]
MPACVVRYCKNYHGSTRGKEEVSYHRFPQDERRFHEWLIAVEPHLKPTTTIEKIREKTAKKNHGVFVCSDHFSPDCCYDNPKAKLLAPHLNRYPPKLLSDDAIPTIFGKSEDSSDSQHNKTAKKQLIEELLQSVAWEKTPPVKIPETQQTVKEEDGQEKKHSDLNNTTSKVCDGTDTVAINIKEEVLDELEESLVNCCNNTAQLLSFDTVGTDAEKEDEEVRTLGNSTSTSPQLSCRTVGTKEVHQEMGLGNCYNINTPPAAGIEIKKEGGQEMNLVNGYNTVTSQLSCSTVGTDVNEGDVQVMILANCYNNTVTSQLSCSTVGTDVNEGDVQMMNLDTVTLNCSTVVGTDVIEEDKQEMDLDSCNNTDTSQLSCSTLKTDVNEGDVQMMDLYNHYADTSLQLTCDAVGPNIAQEDDAEMTLGVSTIDEQSVNTSVIASDETSQFDPTVNLTFVRRFHTYAYCATRAAKQPAKIPAKHVRTRKPAKSKWRVRSYEIQESVPAKADYVGAGHTAADTVQDSKDAAANPALTSVPIILLQPSTASQFSNTNGKEGSKNLQSPKPKQCRKQVLEPKKVDLVFPVGLEMDACISDSTKTTSQLVLETVTDFVEDSELENKLGDDDNTMNSAVSCNVVSVDAKEEDIVEEEDDFDEELSSSEDEKKGNKSDSSWHMSSEEDELFDDSDESVSSCDSDLLEKTERRMQRKICKSKQKKKTSWVCKCQEEFTSQASYYKHKLEAHPVSCEYCEEKFLSAQTLQKHLKTHMPSEDKLDLKGNKLFMCDHCGQFFTKRQMKRHELKISEARPLDQWLIAVRPHLKPPWTVDKIRELRQSDPRAASRASICSDHFSPTCCTESLKAKLLPQGKKKDAKFVLTKDAVPTEFGKKTSRKSSESQRDKRSRKQLVEELLQPVAHEQTGQIRTPITQQTVIVKEEDNQQENLSNGDNNNTTTQLSCGTVGMDIKVEALDELEESLVNCYNNTAQLLSFDAVGTDADEEERNLGNCDNTGTCSTVGTEENQQQMDVGNSYNANTTSQLSCGTPCIEVKKEGGQVTNLGNCYNTNTPSSSTVATIEDKKEMDLELGNCYNTNPPSQLSCGTVGIKVEKNGGQETKPAQSKLPVSLYKVEECVKVDYVGPCHAVSNTSQGSNDAAANSGLTSVPMILPQPSSTRGASCVSEVSKELHLPKQKQCRKQVLEPRKADLVFPKVSEMDHNNSNKTDTSDSTPSQLKWGIVKCTNITEDGEIKKENKNNNTMTSALSWSVVTIDAKEEDVLEEEEDDFDESDEELSSSEDEKRGNKSDSSDWLEKKEQRKQWKKKTWACCGEKFTSDASYYKHRLEAHPVSCEYCEEKFHSSRMLNKHLKTHMPSEDKLDVQGNKLFMCDHCGQFFTKQEMKRHELTISKARPFKCNVKNCKSTFKDKGGLKHHLDNVHNRHRFPCPFEGCKKTFGVKSRMMTHYRGHTDERSHQCSYCGKMFQRTDHLSVHMRIHTGDTPFNCSLCNYSGRQSNCLLWHMKTHHPEHCKKSGNIKVVKPKKKVLGKDALVDKGESDNTSGSAKKTTPYSRRTRSQRGK